MSSSSNLNVGNQTFQEYAAGPSIQIKVIRTNGRQQGIPLQRQDDTVRSIYSRETREWKGFGHSSSIKKPAETGKGKEVDLQQAKPLSAKQVFIFQRDDGHPIYAIGHNLTEAKRELARHGYEYVSNENEVLLSEIQEALMDGMAMDEIVRAARQGKADALIETVLSYLESQLDGIKEARSQLDESSTPVVNEKKIFKIERKLNRKIKKVKKIERAIIKEINRIVSELGDRLLKNVLDLKALEDGSAVHPLADLESNLNQDLETIIQNMKKGKLGRNWEKLNEATAYFESQKDLIVGVGEYSEIYRQLEFICCDLNKFMILMRDAECEIGELYEEVISTKLELAAIRENRPQKQRIALEDEENSMHKTISYVKSLEQKSLDEVESNPVVQTLLKVIEYKEKHPLWHKNG